MRGFEHLSVRIHGNKSDAFQLLSPHPIHSIYTPIANAHDKDSSRWTLLDRLLLFVCLFHKMRFSDDDVVRANNTLHS